MEYLNDKYPIQKIKILREVISKMFGLVLIALFFYIIIIWKGGLSESLQSEPNSIIVQSLILVVFGFIILLDAVYEALYISSFKYFTDGTSISISKGVIAKHEITLPFNRITDLYVDQSVIDRIFGLYDLHFSTPTASSGSAAHIEGLNKAGCHALRALILEALNKNAS